jgi:uncharacterized protein YukE
MTQKRGRKTASSNDEDDDEEVYGGNGEATNSNQQIPLMTWAAGNRTYPWILKRGRAGGHATSLSSGSSCIMGGPSSIRHFSLKTPLPVEETSYNKIEQTLSRRKKYVYNANYSKRKTKDRAALAQQVEESQKQLKKAQQEEAISAARLKHAQESLDDTKDQIEKEREAFEVKMEDMYEEHQEELAQKLKEPEGEINRIDQEIAKIKEKMEEADKRSKEREAAEGKPPVTSRPDTTKSSEAAKITGMESSSATASPSPANDAEKNDTGAATAYSAEERIEGGPDGSDTNEKKRLSSEVKTDSFNKVQSSMDDLNQTKSQLIWLLKQVITAENKRRNAARRRMKEAAKAKAEANKMKAESEKPREAG